MTEQLIPGMIASIETKERVDKPTCLQILDLRKEGSKFRCTWSDGSKTTPGYLGPEMTEPMDGGLVENGGIVRVIEYNCNQNPATGEYILAAFKLEVVCKADPAHSAVKAEPLAVKLEEGAENTAPAPATNVMAQAAATPRSAKENVGPFKTPAAKMAEKYSGTPGFTPPSTGRKCLQPIQALNPYNNNWTLKARVSNKTPMRHSSRNGQNFSVFSITLVDEQGSEIEGTFWRDVADQWYDRITEGKVYFFTKGRVKPANRNFSTARNDYTIDFQNETTIEECADMDPDKMQAKLCYVRLDNLSTLLGRKMLADVLAVVKEVAPLSSVKRKSDGVDLARRDITLVDQSGKMVRLTIWGSMAENEGAELERLTNPVLSISAVRVGDFDGLSLSTVSRSVLQIEPDSPEAAELRRWWTSEGCTAEFAHAGEGLATAKKSGEGRSNERGWLADLKREELTQAPPSAKPEFVNVHATIMNIDPEQTPFFYPADSATGKKVMKDGDGWRLAAEDRPCTSMEWRYFLRVEFADCTGTCNVMLSNDQAEKLLGRKADEMHELKEAGSPEFQAVITAAQFSEWSMTIKSNTSEFKGEVRQRLQGFGRGMQNDYLAESRWLINKIQGLKA